MVQVVLNQDIVRSDLKILRLFCEKAASLNESSMVKKGTGNLSVQMNYQKDVGMSYETQNAPPDDHLEQFLLRFRFFYGKKEPTHFPKILNVISRNTSSNELVEALRFMRKKWKESLFAGVASMEVNGRKLTAEYVLDLWFNAHYFHSNEAKRTELDSLSVALSPDFMKSLMLNAVINASNDILNVYVPIRTIMAERA
jgi:hypothetical protein